MNFFSKSSSSKKNESSYKINLNVYDLHENNETLYPIGLGFYHSGVQIDRDEYTFASGSGIYKHDAQSAPPGVKLRESYSMGSFKGTSKDIENILSQLHLKFQGSDYHVINNNCNAFADEFLKKLLGIGIPAYVNRMAFYGSFFTCFMPESLNQDPTQVNNNSYNNNSNNINNTNRNPSYSMNMQSSGIKLGTNSNSSTATNSITKDIEGSAAIRKEKIRQATLNRLNSTTN